MRGGSDRHAADRYLDDQGSPMRALDVTGVLRRNSMNG